MGRDEVNIAGLAVTFEGALTGWTLCLGLGNDQATQSAFHDPSPLMTLAQADTLWLACNTSPISKAAARAAMPTGVLNWFDTLPAALQDKALQAVYASHRPAAPRATVQTAPAVV